MKYVLVICSLLVLSACTSGNLEQEKCGENEYLNNGMCIEVVNEIVCANNETLEDDVCIPIVEDLICSDYEKLIDDVCVLIPNPEIIMTGALEVTFEAGSDYIEPGVIAMYNDSEIEVIVSGIPDMRTLGTYTITYDAEFDERTAISKTRTITIVDTTPPEIEFNEYDNFKHEIGEPFTNSGIVVIDNSDDYYDINLIVEGTIDVDNFGFYEMSYYAIDTSGNQSETITKMVEVIMKEELSFTDRFMRDNTALYNSLNLPNNYTFGPIEWIRQGLVIEDGEYKTVLYFFLHNEFEGNRVLKGITFICSTGNVIHELEDSVLDYAFFLPIECMRRNKITIVTYAHDEYDEGNSWSASLELSDRSIDPKEILKLKLLKGNMM